MPSEIWDSSRRVQPTNRPTGAAEEAPWKREHSEPAALRVSAIGLGVMGMSEFYGKPDEAENEATLARAVELGVTFWDTADAYGSGHNETMIGRFLARRADGATAIVLATKFGFVRDGRARGGRLGQARVRARTRARGA